jgi:nitronate monooxygenase
MLRTPSVEKWLEDEECGSEQRPEEPLIGEVTFGGMRTPLPRFGGIPPARDATGEIESMDFLAGQCVGLLNEIKSATEIVRKIAQQAGRILTELGQQ